MILILIAIAFAAVMAIGSWRRTFFNLIGAGAYGVVWLVQNLFRRTPPGWLLQFANWCGTLGAGAWNAAQVALGVLSWVLIALSICIFAAISFGSEESLAIIMILLLGILMVIRSLVRAVSYGASPLTGRFPWLAGIDCGIQNTLHSACLGLILVGTGALFLGDSMGDVITFRVFLMGILLVTLLGLSGWFNVGRGPGKLVPVVVIGMFLIMVLPTPIKDFAQGLGRHAGAALNSQSTSHQRGVPNLETNAQLTLAEVIEEATLYVVSGERVTATMTITANTEMACLNPQPSTQKFGLEPMLELALPGPNGEFVQLGTTGWVVARKVRLMGPIHSTDSATASGSTLPLPTKKSFSWTLGVNIAMLLTGLAIVAFVLTALSLLVSSGKERVSAAKLLAALAIVIIIGFAAVTVLADLSPEAASSAGGPGLVQTASAAQLPNTPAAPPTSTTPAAAAPVRAANAPSSSPTVSEEADEAIRKAAANNGLTHPMQLAIFRALNLREGGGRLLAPDGADGEICAMQIMPDTARSLGVEPRRLRDPDVCFNTAARLVKQYFDEFGYRRPDLIALAYYSPEMARNNSQLGRDQLLRAIDRDLVSPAGVPHNPRQQVEFVLNRLNGNTARVAQARAAPPGNQSAEAASADQNSNYTIIDLTKPLVVDIAIAQDVLFSISAAGRVKRSAISPWVDCQGEDKHPRREKDPLEFILPDERIMLPLAKINGQWEAVGCQANFAGPATIESLWVNGRAHTPARYNMVGLQKGTIVFTITQ